MSIHWFVHGWQSPLLRRPRWHYFLIHHRWLPPGVTAVLLVMSLGLTGIVVLALLTHRQLKTVLGQLATAAEAVGRGEYPICLPRRDSAEVYRLTKALTILATRLHGRASDCLAISGTSDCKLSKELTEATTHHSLQRMVLLGEVASTAVHQISQPITAIANYAGAGQQLLRLGRLDPEQLQVILEHISRMATRAGTALEHLRHLAPRREVQRIPTEINAVIAVCLSQLTERIERENVLLYQDLANALPSVLVDPWELEKAFLHLLNNAFDAVQSRPPERRVVTLVSHPLVVTGGVSLQIRDAGDGIPATVLERLFEPWVTTKTNHVGLGLYIAHTLIEMYEGRLWLDRTCVTETVFVVELPAPMPGTP